MSVVWSTEKVSEHEQFRYWREAISSAFVPLEPSRREAERFEGKIYTFGPSSLGATTVAAERHHVALTRGGIARQRGNPFFLNLVRCGEAEVTQNGERDTARPGDVYVVDSSAPWSVDFTCEFEIFCLSVDESALRPRLGSRGKMAAPVLSGTDGPGSVLARYMGLIRNLPENEIEGMENLMVEHCAALLARANAGAPATPPNLRDQRASLRAVLAFIDANLTDPTLTPENACKALRVSRSYLYKLLLEGGFTFEGYVRRARLGGCREALLKHRDMPISQVAANWGFVDTSSFNRAYRREFGETPSQSRGLRSGSCTEPEISADSRAAPRR